MSNKEFILEVLKILMPLIVGIHVRQPSYMRPKDDRVGKPDPDKG